MGARLGKLFATVLLFAASLSAAHSLSGVSPEDAIHHVGERATVCGTVVSVKYSTRSSGQPTFLNLDYAYPRQVFTALVWGRGRLKFPYPPESTEGKNICIHGLIKDYKATAESIVKDPFQVSVQ